MINREVQLENIPTRLIDCEQWICWREAERDGKKTKLPVNPLVGQMASTTDPTTWTDIDTTTEYVDRATTDADGIGFVFSAEDPFVGIDLDDCRDPETGTGDEWAIEIIDQLDSYTEVSPSGTGYHVIVRGELTTDRNRKGDIEIYETARFFTVTGEHVEGTPDDVTERNDPLAAIQQEYLQENSDEARESRSLPRSSPEIENNLGDEELIDKAKAAKNGDRFERLWEGNTLNYDSHSEADMALCFHLAFWTGGDQARIDRLFRRSGLMREKWDEVHYADGSTYGEKSVERAVAKTTDVYTPSKTDETAAFGNDKPSTVVEHGRATSQQPYLAERNRLLKERVTELETTVEQKDDRIGVLEAHIERLGETLTAQEMQNERSEMSEDGDDEAKIRTDPSSSAWTRVRRILFELGR